MDKPSWAQNPVQHDPTHYRVSDAELHRKINVEDAKEKHGWSKPEWSMDGSKVQKPVPIDTTPIPKPMLKKTAQSEAMLKEKTISEEEQKALQARLAAARKGVKSEEPAEDPTANMTPEQKAKYIADQRLIAIREQTEAKELAAWKANQDEVRAIEKERREAAKRQALAQQKEREAQEKKDREKKAEAMKNEQEAQKQKEVELLQQQIAALKAQLGEGTAPASPTAPAPEPVVVKSPSLQDKHKWSKPGWALPEEAIQQEEGIVTDSIQNGLKKPTTGGYERKVFAKQLAPPVKQAKFVRNLTAKKPDPRMVWIVINVNGVKRGKIVMHLHGNADAIVDKFLELKGLEMSRQNGMLVCTELEPHFYVSGGQVAELPTNNPQAVYGVIMEGADVFQQAMNAQADAVISIKQSHIFPVKRAKS